ncbi:MAG: DUF2892 domain-containing protein [Candidatus Marinimicrobia bacterium]|jgi:hypothetical protein|nr:DUF2892 domain-containing protein [Candidatus Neomarinimicrobiota bacterium]MBT3576543.1 DUF2892 domain-containing protein [Candidatus Neomarinimicrobiota bacterium]MBT3680103.1 DUF2892 domain-containing protein [Candidatus Neomarinimicrobiota bacterium]MBT3951310.1 DUF2892 domain-containing protein [Candidatus Neomarinimicrobiota bacterium]MBT4253055.1 DUF2892 domain-containing protein [Candidatus Neomarinimicrobiota bacterium]
MAEEQRNVGQLDSIIRIILGALALGSVVYHFVGDGLFPIYLLVVVIILVPFFLKTGLTKVCPIMKAIGVSTYKEA